MKKIAVSRNLERAHKIRALLLERVANSPRDSITKAAICFKVGCSHKSFSEALKIGRENGLDIRRQGRSFYWYPLSSYINE